MQPVGLPLWLSVLLYVWRDREFLQGLCLFPVWAVRPTTFGGLASGSFAPTRGGLLARSHQNAAADAALRKREKNKWAQDQVQGTWEALWLRSACESLGVLLWRAGVGIPAPALLSEPQPYNTAFEGALVRSEAAASDDPDDWEEDWSTNDWENETWHEDWDDVAPKSQRRAGQSAPKRIYVEKAWVPRPGGPDSCIPTSGEPEPRHQREKVMVKALARPRRQQQALTTVARQKVALARRLREAQRSQRPARRIR